MDLMENTGFADVFGAPSLKNIGKTNVIREFRAPSHSSLVVRVSRIPKIETVETKQINQISKTW